MTQKKTYRIEQVNRLLREEIASILLTELQDESMSALTVTGVRSTRDLSTAIVFISTHKDEDVAPILENINRKAGFIRKLIFPRLRLKRVPSLEFRYDDALDTAERIYQTLERIHEDEPDGERTED